MKTRRTRDTLPAGKDEMKPEYRFDYGKSRPNRFAKAAKEGPVVVMLDEDIATVFRTPESVKTALRALISAMPHATRRKATPKRFRSAS